MPTFVGVLNVSGYARDTLGDTVTASGSASLTVAMTVEPGGVIDTTTNLSGNVHQINHYFNNTSYEFDAPLSAINVSGVTNISDLHFPIGVNESLNGVTLAVAETIDIARTHIYINASASFSYARTVYPYEVATPTTYYGTAAIGGTLLSSQPLVACFCRGTHIRTHRGELPIERLQIADLVHTTLGATPAPVTWIGHRRIDCTRHPKPHLVWPVRIMRGAFGDGMPQRDLWLSPDHAVYLNGVLIPVKYLINGFTIAQVPVADVTYFHVELPHHDVLLAEGLPVESYLETGDRANFSNGGAALALHADFATRTWEAHGCAPLVVGGPALDAARAMLIRRLDRRSAA